ncbi:MAG TPA: hypothetical protein VNJ03_12550 [Vicinamibacterales bacterium]|nr:hypothetical protein [Vicinamibacterales bacterium]
MRQGLTHLSLPLVLVAFCFPLFLGLQSTDLDNDEAIYAYAVESILSSGDWVSPLSSPTNDVVFLEKPHLKFWIVALPIRLGLLPYDAFGLRVWDALFGAIAFVYVFLIGRRLSGSFCGAVAVLVLFAHRPLIFDHGLRSTNMDAALVLAYCGGVYHYLRWTGAAGRGHIHVAAIAACFYLGFMTKFVAALFLPAVLAVCVVLVGPHRRQFIADRRQWALASAGVAAAVIPWFVYQHLAHGATLWNVMFGEHVYTRFTAYADPGHLQPWHFYVTRAYGAFVDGGSALWVGVGLIVLGAETIRRRRADGMVVLLWLALPLLLISLGSSKLYHYLYPFLPPLALAAGYGAAWIAGHLARLSAPLWIRVAAFEPAVSPGIRVAATALMVGAGLLALWTAIAGSVRLEAGGHLLFRNASIVRPLLVAIACAALAGGVRTAAAGAVVLALAGLVPVPLAAYAENLHTLRVDRRPLERLGACLRDVDEARRARGEAVVDRYSPVSGGFLHSYFYYLRGGGWLDPAVDDARLRAALFVQGQEAPVVIERASYSAFLERVGPDVTLPPAVSRPGILVLLPGPYGACDEARPEPRR